MFDKTITIYNKQYDPIMRPDTKKQTRWAKIVVHGVSWSGKHGMKLGGDLRPDDGYSVRIPAYAMPDGFLVASEYAALEDKSGHWTAQTDDVVLLGVGPDVESGITEITKRFTDCFSITHVGTASLSRALPHLRIEGE